LVFNEVPTPTIARDEILVKIKSTAVNHLDLVEASGTARQILPIDLPWIPGHEFSGVIEQIGSDVAAYAPGDAVFGTTSGMGAYAEYLAVKAAAIARKPANLSFEEAASVPVASKTAWQGIFTHGHLEKGQTILIQGGGGAVGAYAVQLASHAGATVIATASGDDEAYLNSIGASRVIDYREAQFEKVLREKVDVVFDLVGGDTQKRSFLVLKEGGYLVAATQPVSQEESARHRVTGAMMRLAPSGNGLSRVARLLEEGTIRPDVATVYALQDAAQAWKDIAGNLPGVHGMSASWPGTAGRRSHGKIVLRVAWCKKKESMAERIHELLLRNLQEVFGEGDPAKRRSAIRELYTDDCVLYVPPGTFVGHDALDKFAGDLRATHPHFAYAPHAAPQALHNSGRLKWGSGPRGGVPAYTGEDVIIVRDEKIAALYVFLDSPPA
jgi:NADPH:quinone reductase-like Zn-dependent oxidoreductase